MNQEKILYWTQQHLHTQSRLDFLTMQYHVLLGESLMSTNVTQNKSNPEFVHADIWKFLNGFVNFYETEATLNCSIIMTKRGIQAMLLYKIFTEFAQEMNLENKVSDKNWFFDQFNILFKKYPSVISKKRGNHIKYIFNDCKALKLLLQDQICLYDPTIHISKIKKDVWDKPFDE